jgi:hypothetical protein
MLRHIPPSRTHFVPNSNKARWIGLFGDRGFAVSSNKGRGHLARRSAEFYQT